MISYFFDTIHERTLNQNISGFFYLLQRAGIRDHLKFLYFGI